MRSFLFAALVLSFGAAQAQSPYRPFPEANAGWVETHGMFDFTMGMEYWQTCEHTIESGTDTTINDTVFHELRIRGHCGSSWPDQWWLDEHTFCWFRQDTVERKVFVFDPDEQHGVLWFDFNLPVGPYPVTWGNPNGWSTQITALDSVELNDGWHRTWILGYVENGQVLDSAFGAVIEGVGSTLGLNPLHGLVYPFEWSDQLDCHSVNGQALYPLGAAECDLTMGNEAAQLPDTDPHIVPNPVQESLQLDAGSWSRQGWRYRIFDVSGREVVRGTVKGGAVDSPLNVSGLEAGHYVFHYEVPGQAARSTRFIKQ